MWQKRNLVNIIIIIIIIIIIYLKNHEVNTCKNT